MEAPHNTFRLPLWRDPGNRPPPLRFCPQARHTREHKPHRAAATASLPEEPTLSTDQTTKPIDTRGGRHIGQHRRRIPAQRLHLTQTPLETVTTGSVKRAIGRAKPGGRLIVVVPAHNEEQGIRETVQALHGQTYRPNRVIVVADNCTDDTAGEAYRAGAQVLSTDGNTHKKAGALNQVFAELLPQLADDDLVMVVDADSQLDADFLNFAVSKLNADPGLGAVGGIFRGSEGGGFVGHLQRNEYARYARDVARLKGKCLVVTGTAALFRAVTLKRVKQERLAGRLPTGDGRGGIYDTSVLTEDNELTFALLHLGYRVLSPKECTLTTEVMESWLDLWRQRHRWKRGAIENCVQYGLTKVTWRYWGRQIFTMFGVLVTFTYLATVAYSLTLGHFHLQPLWMAVSAVFVVERVVTVRHRGWKHMLVAATMYELILDMFLQFVHAKAYADALLGRERNW
ncbi:glycosyltransferase family 2 protein [Paractinoplanes durhamensis]|nr:glycosyltransferase family 2 protein [Actinoplanes durhamensis]